MESQAQIDAGNSQTKTETTQQKPSVTFSGIFMCSTPQCGKASTLQCPTCVKMDLPPAFFCSQECFKSFWGIHKLFHQKKDKPVDNYKYTGTIRPGIISPARYIPSHIPKPDYFSSGYPTAEMNSKANRIIETKTKEEIENLRQACLIGRKALDLGHSMVKPGVTTEEIDQKVHEYIISQDAYPSPYNYHNFPKSICTSVNEIVCHGIPDSRSLEEGDIVNLDISVYYKGMNSDLNETFAVGKVDDESLYLMEHTYKALEKAIAICKPDVMYKEIGNVIEKYAKEHGLSVIRSYTGHGVGQHFHCAPNIPHYANNKTVGFMKEGHCFTIEPMINQGVWKDVLWNDQWTVATADGKRSAQFEHTLVITADGCEVLTKRLETSPPLDFKI